MDNNLLDKNNPLVHNNNTKHELQSQRRPNNETWNAIDDDSNDCGFYLCSSDHAGTYVRGVGDNYDADDDVASHDEEHV